MKIKTMICLSLLGLSSASVTAKTATEFYTENCAANMQKIYQEKIDADRSMMSNMSKVFNEQVSSIASSFSTNGAMQGCVNQLQQIGSYGIDGVPMFGSMIRTAVNSAANEIVGQVGKACSSAIEGATQNITNKINAPLSKVSGNYLKSDFLKNGISINPSIRLK